MVSITHNTERSMSVSIFALVLHAPHSHCGNMINPDGSYTSNGFASQLRNTEFEKPITFTPVI